MLSTMQFFANIALICSAMTLTCIHSCNRVPLQDIPATPNVTFDQHIKPITSTVCIRCHSGRFNDWSQYNNAFSHRLSIYQRVVVDRSMPAGTFLDDKDRALFRDWVNQGAKQ